MNQYNYVNVAKIYHEQEIFKTGAGELEGGPIISLDWGGGLKRV